MAKTVKIQMTAYVYDHDDEDDQAAYGALCTALGLEDATEQPLGASIMVMDAVLIRVEDGER